MRKHIFILSLLLCSFFTSFAQVLSPSEFLGFELGSRFTPHHQIISYVDHVNQQLPANSKIEIYGHTNEMRPLEVIFIGSADHISSLTEVKKSQIEIVSGSKKPTTNDPVIIWLSYNVHGNEASGSEAFMKVLYDLAIDPNNFLSGDVLYILDPCINPDGRDRYANWYNQMIGKNLNTDPNSREHKEPWPGGRTNHYGFDLNRDWLWKTQLESIQRMALYEQWLPHVHADFHEMGAEDSYYFPPAAKPFHEDITVWQRQFQQILGNTIKKDFDKNGWSYFTRENYDLLYPSYGDTYPIFNGAIGMTLEQGGSGKAGLSYIQETGETLTLLDRLTHHHSVSFGIIEAARTHKTRLNEEYATFFQNARSSGVGKYKYYLVKNTNQGRMHDLQAFLSNNNLDFSEIGSSQKAKGYSYNLKKEEEFTADSGDILITTKQTKGMLASVLFEPTTYLEDSNTYDITAWALPYVYDLKAYALNKPLKASSLSLKGKINFKTTSKAYAYAVKWNHINQAQFLSAILKEGIQAKVQTTSFSIDDEVFQAGTLILQPTEKQLSTFIEIVNAHDIRVRTLKSGMVTKGPDLGSSHTRPLAKPKVALLTGTGTSVTSTADMWYFFDETLKYPISLLDTRYVSKVDLSEYNTIILADGSYSKLGITPNEIGEWVSDGGKLILIEDAIKWVEDSKEFQIKKKKDIDQKKNQKLSYSQRSEDRRNNQIVGAIFKTQIDNSHPLGYGYDSDSYFLLNNRPRYELLEKEWNVGYLDSSSYMTGLVGKKAMTHLDDSLIFGVEQKGSGHIIYMQTNPLFRSFWEAGKLLFANSIFMVD